PHVKTVLRQVRRVLGQEPRVAVIGLPEHDPADVGPPGALARGVRVARLVRLLMVNPVYRDPENWTALQRKRAANGKEVFQNPWDLIRAVSVKAMITQTDAQTDRDPVQKRGGRHHGPAEHEERRNSSDMQQNQYDSGKP